MRSIRARLLAFLLGGVGVLIIAAGFILEVNISSWLESEFDLALESEARALVTLTKEEQGEGEVELDFADEFMPEFMSSADPHYFEVWLDETLLERSNSFMVSDERSRARLPRLPEPSEIGRFANIRLPDERSGRLIQIDFVPQTVEEGASESPVDGRPLPADEVVSEPTGSRLDPRLLTATVLVARERETLDGQITRLRWSLVGFTGLLLGTVAVLVAVSLRIGLRPLERLARQVGNLEAESLDRLVDLDSPPRELAPVVDQLNELLSRLQTAFRRERQLTSDIAHELRTPIAELRNLCEVHARWPDDPKMTSKFFEDAWTIGLQMERMVTNLLALARYDEGAEKVTIHQIRIGESLLEAWKPLAQQADEKNLTFESNVSPDAVLETDPVKFHLILSNLLTNAVSYSRPGTAVTSSLETLNGRSSLTISNRAAHLDAEDLPLMFERFWRKDPARSGGRSSGLGLAIVKAFAGLLGFEVEARLERDDLLEITLSPPKRSVQDSKPS